jgi:hypothetical protein
MVAPESVADYKVSAETTRFNVTYK